MEKEEHEEFEAVSDISTTSIASVWILELFLLLIMKILTQVETANDGRFISRFKVRIIDGSIREQGHSAGLCNISLTLF